MNKEKEFTKIYKENFKLVYRFLYRRTGTVQDTEDIVSETFSALWENFENIDSDRNVRAWTFGIALHKLNDFLRRRYRLEFSIDADKIEQTIEQEEKKVDNKKYVTILDELISKLGSREKKFIKLKYKDKLTNREIAQKLKITMNNAKVINNRLIKKLKQLWQNHKS